ncbi:DUF2254 domain-containing protein [soil metagenome]
MTNLQYIWEELNASFWFVPILMLTIAIGSAFGFIYLDNQLDYTPDGFLKFIFSASADSARSILSTIAGASIGVAGTVFSITLVVLTLATSQMGSRLLSNFMYDRLNQVVLGTYVSTFVYCLIVLNSITETEEFEFIPFISVFMALIAAVASIILLIVFIHHISVSMQSNKVIANISESMLKNIDTFFPEKMGANEGQPSPDLEAIKKSFSFQKNITSSESGYLQSVDSDDLMKLAKKEDLLIIIKYKPGDYLVKDLKICEVLGHEKLDESISDDINDTLITSQVRTTTQDVEFSIHQIVEIASRALSTGVNDPYTAIACIDNLTTIMTRLAAINFPSPWRYDEDGRFRINAEGLTFSGMMDTSFNQIRQYAEENPTVMIRLMDAFITIDSFAENRNQREHILKHADMVMNAAENSFVETRDLDDIRSRYNTL